MTKPVRIEKWGVKREEGDGYQPPEVLPQYLVGEVTGHPRKTDGTLVHTSSIVKFDKATGIVLTRSGTTYELGAPHPEYAKKMADLGVQLPGFDRVRNLSSDLPSDLPSGFN